MTNQMKQIKPNLGNNKVAAKYVIDVLGTWTGDKESAIEWLETWLDARGNLTRLQTLEEVERAIDKIPLASDDKDIQLILDTTRKVVKHSINKLKEK